MKESESIQWLTKQIKNMYCAIDKLVMKKHNEFRGLQGGDKEKDEYYHLNKEQYDSLGQGGSFEQINSDWSSTSGVSEILNKPKNVSEFNNDSGYITVADIPPLDYIPLKGTEEGTYIEGRFNIGENLGTEQTYLDLSKESMNYDFTQNSEVGVFKVGKTGLHYKNILDWFGNKEMQTLTTQNRGFYMETSDLDYNQLAYISLDKRGVHIGTDNYLENPIHYSSFSISPQTGVEIRCTSEEHGLYSNRVFIPVTDAHYVQRRWVTNYVTGALPTKTSDLANDGEDGVSPYTTENHVSINYLRYDRANTVVSNRFNIHSDYGNHSGFNFDYDYPQMFYGTNYLRMTDDSFLDIRVGAGVDINAPYLSINGEIYASAHVASSLFKFTNATTVTTPRTLHTDGTNVKYTGNDGVPRDLAFASDIKTGIFNPPTLAQLTALNIKRGDFYKDINTGQIALFDGEQLTEWIITSVTQWNSLTPEQKAAVKIFSYQKDE